MSRIKVDLKASVLQVQAVYPKAIPEWPEQRCSISAYPGGPEISSRCNHAGRAWVSAAKQLAGGTKCVHTQAVVSEVN
jgi:hypothetical protein